MNLATNVTTDPVVWAIMMATASLIGLSVFLSMIFSISAVARDRTNGAVGGFFLVLLLMIALPLGGCVIIKTIKSTKEPERIYNQFIK